MFSPFGFRIVNDHFFVVVFPPCLQHVHLISVICLIIFQDNKNDCSVANFMIQFEECVELALSLFASL